MLDRFDTSRFRVRIGGQLPNWSTEGYVEGKEAKRIDRFAQFALVGGHRRRRAIRAWISPARTCSAAA